MEERKRILVIEDDPIVRYNIVSYLEDCGFIIVEEENGQKGLAQVRNGEFDLVLCDLRMPGLDGMEVLRVLRTELPELPLVIVSGTGILSDVVEALRKGAWDFVTKPILDMAMLEHAINGALEKSRLIRDNNRYQRELEQANRVLREHLDQFEQDAAAGRAIQLQLMPPQERRMGNCRFSRYLLPSLYLSGDFVDYFDIDRRHIGFFLADVSGHGVSSAFVTVLLKSFIYRYRELLYNEGDRSILDPARLLMRLNRDFLIQHLDKYLTIFYGVLDSEANRLVYSNGGHFPTPILFNGQHARFIECRGMPVGLFPEPPFAREELELPEKYVLALFSDGVFDALSETNLVRKRARLLQAVNCYGLTAETLLASLGLTPGFPHPDDITLLIAERVT